MKELSTEEMDRIYRYLQNEMDDAERQLFETDLAKDEHLAEKIKLHREIDEALFFDNEITLEKKKESNSNSLLYESLLSQEKNKKKYKELRRMAKKSSLAHRSKNQGFRLSKWTRSIAATAVIGLLGIMIWMIATDNERLYDRYKDYERLPSIGTKSQNQEPFLDVELAFNDRNYKQAHELFIQEEAIENRELGLIYDALALIEMNQEDQAIAILEAMADDEERIYNEWAEWYLALAYIKNGAKAKAKVILNEIANNKDHIKSSNAYKLFQKL